MFRQYLSPWNAMRPTTVVGWMLLVGLLTCSDVRAVPWQETPVSDYGRALADARSAVDSGKRDEALALLNATEPSQRGFEFDYLQQLADPPADTDLSSQLVQHVPVPDDVQTRYAVLHPIRPEIVFICRDGGIRVVMIDEPGHPSRTIADPQSSAVWTGRFSRDGKWFFTGHQDGRVLIRDTASWEIEHTVQVSDDWPVRELAVSADGQAFVAESREELVLWSIMKGTPKSVCGVGERYNFGEGVAFSPRGDLIATGGMFDIRLLDAKTGTEQAVLSHASYTMGLEFSPDGRRIASAPRGNVNKFLAVFDIESNAMLFNDGPFASYVAGLAFSPDGRRLAATGCENTVRLFDAATGEILLSIPRDECSTLPGFSEEGRRLGWSEPKGFYFIRLGPASDTAATPGAPPE